MYENVCDYKNVYESMFFHIFGEYMIQYVLLRISV